MRIEKIKKDILPIFKKYQVKKASIFGSFARGEDNLKSDIDFLIEFERGKTLLDLISLEESLTKKLKRKVDVITYNSINPSLKKNILRDEIKIFLIK